MYGLAPSTARLSRTSLFMSLFTLYKHRSNHVGDDALGVPFLSLILWSYKFIVS